ncbi:hypothetical protein HGH92_24600 [Chitinophaga varians]|uniref:Uncharacterized protein n=1 Tax=Chitinophaga varians TaxID=2202339 RepID=A0A847S336_9BACT|nr:hypothetical protein [Chitinophaga varians]NLR67508.1 hypothetical protein [Chitinophaga varians]
MERLLYHLKHFELNFWLCPIMGITMIVVVLWQHFFPFRFRRDTSIDIPPAPLPAFTEPVRSLIQPVDQYLFLAQLKLVVTSTELLMKDVPDDQWDYAAVFRRSSNFDHPPAFMAEGGFVNLDLDVFYEPHDIGLALAVVAKGRKDVRPASWQDILLKGKIVAHEICASLIDGGCEAVSNVAELLPDYQH